MNFILLNYKLNPLVLFERYNFSCYAFSKLILLNLLYHTKLSNLQVGVMKKYVIKKVGHGTKRVGNHCSSGFAKRRK